MNFKLIIDKIEDIFKDKAIEAHIFGSIARGDFDLYSDIDIWLTFNDNQIKDVISQRFDYYSKLGEVIHINEAPQNSPVDGIHSFVLYKILDELLRIDYSLCPESTSFQTDESKKLFGINLPLGKFGMNPKKVIVDNNYRIDFVISFVFNSIKYIIRKKENSLGDLITQYNYLHQKYGIAVKPATYTEHTFLALKGIINNLIEVSNDKQKNTLLEIQNYITKVENRNI